MGRVLALLLALSLRLAQHPHGAPATPRTSPERSFLSGMIAHHEGALERVRVALPGLKDPEFRTWAEAILEDQEGEIRAMRAFLQRFGGLDQGWPRRWPPWWPGSGGRGTGKGASWS